MNRPDGTEMAGRTAHMPPAHMQNFFDCIRDRKEPNCPLSWAAGYPWLLAWRSKDRLGRTVRWDPDKEEIV